MKILKIILLLVLVAAIGYLYQTKFVPKEPTPQDIFLATIKAAEEGDADAQFQVGDLFFYGRGLADQNYDTAMYWYEQAGNNGHERAAIILGDVYYFGEHGIAVDRKRAMHWYEKMAEKNDPVALNNLANIYQAGKVVPKNEQYATVLYERAAEQGYPIAQSNLVVGYLHNNDEANYDKALKMAQSAYDQGYIPAAESLGRMYLYGKGTAVDLHKAQKFIEMPQKKNTETIFHYTLKGDLYFMLAEQGEQDYSQALFYYNKAANLGNGYAHRQLGMLYKTGKGVEKNYQKSIVHYQLAYANGDKNAGHNLAYLWAFEKNAPSNFPEAKIILDDLMEQYPEDAYVHFLLGLIYKRGLGVDRDDWMARELFIQACQLGEKRACN